MALTVAEINSIIAAANSRSETALMRVQAEVANSSSLLFSLYNAEPIDLSQIFDDPTPPEAFEPAETPTLQPVEVDTSGAPGAVPTLKTVPGALDGLGAVPEFNETAPLFTLPSSPGLVRSFTDQPPTITTDVVFPTAPAALDANIVAPELSTITIPNAPQLVMPSFDALKPELTAQAPDDLQGTFLAQYREQAPVTFAALDGKLDELMARYYPQHATQLAKLEAQVAEYMAGNTALPIAAENAYYERARDKTTAEARRLRDAAWSDAARRGFTTPPGSALSALQASRQSEADNFARAAQDIAIEQSKLAMQKAEFAMTMSASLRQNAMSASLQYHGNLVSLNAQALDVAKFVVTSMIQSYNIAVDGYKAALEGYRADAAVFETKLRGVQAVISLFEAQLRAVESQVNVDKSQVDLYRAQLDALGVMANTYKTRVEAVVSKAQLEKLKIDLFSAQVQAYSAEVQGNAAAWNGYSAAIRGKETEVSIYTEKAKAWAVRVDGWKATLAARSTEIQAVTSSNEGVLKAYTAAYQGYGEKMRAEAIRVNAFSDNQRLLVQAYEVANRAAVARFQAAASLYGTQAEIAVARGRAELSQLQETTKIKLAAATGITQNAAAAAETYGRAAASAMSGMNTLVGRMSTE